MQRSGRRSGLEGTPPLVLAKPVPSSAQHPGQETIITRTSGTLMNHEAVITMDVELDWCKVHDQQRHAIIAQSLRG